MNYWEFNQFDCICSDYLAPLDGKIPFLYVGAINTLPERQSQHLLIETLHLKTDAEFIELRTLDFGNNWPSQAWIKHQVVHSYQWGQRWTDGGGAVQSGVNTEIVRSRYEVDPPESGIILRFPPQIDLLDFNCCLYPGQVLLFIPSKKGCHLSFTFKLYKFVPPTNEAVKETKKNVFSELQHWESLLHPIEDLFRLIAKVDPSLTPKKRKLIVQNLDLISSCIAELIEVVA